MKATKNIYTKNNLSHFKCRAPLEPHSIIWFTRGQRQAAALTALVKSSFIKSIFRSCPSMQSGSARPATLDPSHKSLNNGCWNHFTEPTVENMQHRGQRVQDSPGWRSSNGSGSALWYSPISFSISSDILQKTHWWDRVSTQDGPTLRQTERLWRHTSSASLQA